MPNTRRPDRAAQDVNINVRASLRQRSLIDRAAEALGKSRSAFMLEASCREAEAVLLERRYFALDADSSRNLRPCWMSRPRAIRGCAVC